MTVKYSSIDRDEEGYLVDPEDWTRELAGLLAEEESIRLAEDHWLILRYIRDYHDEHGITPDIRHVASHLGEQKGCAKKAAKALIFELFPYGYVKQACKIAGMMRPRAWSTG